MSGTSCPAPAANPVHGSVGKISPSTTGENGVGVWATSPHRCIDGIRRSSWARASTSTDAGDAWADGRDRARTFVTEHTRQRDPFDDEASRELGTWISQASLRHRIRTLREAVR